MTEASVPETAGTPSVPCADAAPSVTCVIVAYNHAPYVEEALDSALAQTYPNLRIIVFDDASTDGTPGVIREHLATHGREDVLFVSHKENRGLCATLNEALDLVDSDYVAFISADDTQEPSRFDYQVARLEELGQEYAMVYSNARRIDKFGEYLKTTYPTDRAQPEGDLFIPLLNNYFLTAVSLLTRTAVLKELGPYDETLSAEDYHMSLRIACRYKISYVPRPLVATRVVPGSLTSVMLGNILDTSMQQHRMLSEFLGVRPQGDLVISTRLIAFSKEIYLSGGDPRFLRQDLLRAFPRHLTPRSAVYMTFVTLHVPGRPLRRIIDAIRYLKLRAGMLRSGR